MKSYNNLAQPKLIYQNYYYYLLIFFCLNVLIELKFKLLIFFKLKVTLIIEIIFAIVGVAFLQYNTLATSLLSAIFYPSFPHTVLLTFFHQVQHLFKN